MLKAVFCSWGLPRFPYRSSQPVCSTITRVPSTKEMARIIGYCDPKTHIETINETMGSRKMNATSSSPLSHLHWPHTHRPHSSAQPLDASHWWRLHVARQQSSSLDFSSVSGEASQRIVKRHNMIAGGMFQWRDTVIKERPYINRQWLLSI